MNFERFEKILKHHGFGIAAMNHYSLNGKSYLLYCVVLRRETVFQEGGPSSDVFRRLVRRIQRLDEGPQYLGGC